MERLTVGRIPPQSPEAEAAVLGAMLLDQAAIDRVADALSREDFYSEANRKVFGAIVELSRHQKPVDLLTLTEELRARGELDAVGGATYVTALVDGAVTSTNIEYYARIIRERSLLRRLGSTTGEIAARCYEPVEDVGRFVDEAEEAVFRVAERGAERYFARAGTLLKSAFLRVEELYERQETVTGVPTGFTELDRLTAGFQPSNLVIVAGRPSVGKTAFCLNVAENAAIARNIGVGIFSLEMSREELVLRLLCSQAEVNLASLRTGRLRRDDFPKLARAAGRIEDAPIYIDDTAGIGALELRARARRLAREPEAKLGLLVVDYLQLVNPSRGSPNRSREQEIAEISRSLKALAKELSLPVVALSQLNRQIESRPDNRPRMSDLRDSGSLEQDADVIAFLFRGKEDPGDLPDVAEVTVSIAKHRNGPVGDVTLFFRRSVARFENPESVSSE